MNDDSDRSTVDNENAVNNTIPANTFLVMEGVKAIPLNRTHITVGRSHDNVVVVDDPRVSRHHMEIRVIREQFVLFDLGSSGGTYVNSQRTNQVILYSGDLISLAGVNFVFTRDTRLTDRGSDQLSSDSLSNRDTVTFNTSRIPKKKNK